MSDTELKALERKLDQLIQLCARLSHDNDRLRQQESEWQTERQHLVEKNEMVRTRVEAMITRLKNLEQEA